MAVSLTLTPEPAHLPPRMRLDLATGDPARAFSDITVRRDGAPLRSEAILGGAASVIYDYDCRYTDPVTYVAEGSAGGFATLLDETWGDLSGWDTVSGSPAVTAGRLNAGAVRRDLAAPGRFTLHSPSTLLAGGGGRIRFQHETSPGVWVTDLEIGGAGSSIYVAAGDFSWSVATLPGTGDWVLTGNQVTSSAGSWTLPVGIDPGASAIYCSTRVPAFLAESGSAPASFSLTAVAELDSVEAWLIHPIDPDLSVQISTLAEGGRLDRIYVERDAGKSITYRAQRELFAPLGRPRQVPVTFGPRRPGEWPLVLRTPRQVDRAAIESLIADGSPILIRVPATFPWDLTDGWYDVDDVDSDRIVDTPTSNPRTFTLPLIPVDAPVLTQGAQWTWADVLANYDTWADVLAAFPTWMDLLLGPQS